MIDSKLTFRVPEIPAGKSSRSLVLDPADLEFEGVGDVTLKRAVVEIEFEKTDHFVKVDFTVQADLIITCDRSLKEFDQLVEGRYEVLFKPVVEQAAEGETSKVKEMDARDLTLRIDQEVRDTILLELPIKKLHPDLLDEEGRPLLFDTRTFGPDPESEETVDPRWEVLKKLKRES